MRVCVISTSVFKVPVAGYSGLEHLAYQQAAGLAALGHDVALVAPEGSECPGATVIPCGPAGTWDEKTSYGRYWNHLPNFDVIIDNTWCKWSYILKEEGVLKKPVLGVMHAPVNTMYQTLPAVEKPCFVCISKDQAAHFEAMHGNVRAEVCYNGVDLDFYKPLDIPRSGRFLFLARFSTIKGPDLAIDACKKAGAGLDLVGDTSITNEPAFLEACRKQCDEFPIRGYGDVTPSSLARVGTGMATLTSAPANPSKRIRLVGPATRGECVWWFSQAHCLVHPNQRFREPFGLAPVEAMACGCPVIAWDHGAMRETVLHGETGWLVRSQDELVQAVKNATSDWNDTDPRKRRWCREWAGQFSIQKMIARYEELCEKAVSGGW